MINKSNNSGQNGNDRHHASKDVILASGGAFKDDLSVR